MNTTLFFATELAFAAAVLFLLPYLSPRRIFFGITVAPEFPESAAGRGILRRYRIGIAAIVAIAAALGLTAAKPVRLPGLGLALTLFAGIVMFWVGRSQTAPFAAPPAAVREASLDTAPDRLPRWFAIGLLAFALPGAAAAYLSAHWEEIPARFPVHWGANGVPNRWVEKSAHAVYGPEIACAALVALLLLLAIATFYGARRAALRMLTLKITIAACFFTSLIFTDVALMPLGRVPIWAILAPAAIFPFAILIWISSVIGNPEFEPEPTPDDCWHLGQLYYNPDDPALFVQKRMGLGYTFNMANRMSWAILAGLAAVVMVVIAMVR